jgi:uncharacterized protein (TIGR02145 family)
MVIASTHKSFFRLFSVRLKSFSMLVCIVLFATIATAQNIAINTTGDTAHPSALLDLQSTEKGLLPPRMTAAQRNAISNPGVGLIIYNLSSNCLNTFDGTQWKENCGNCSPENTVLLSSSSETVNQNVCKNAAILPITYNTTGCTGASFYGLPQGVSGSWSNNTITISGTPTTIGSFNFLVLLNGGCGSVYTTGNITVSNSTLQLSSAVGTDAQTITQGSPITNITYNAMGATGANFSGLPAGVSGSWSNNVVTIAGTPTGNIGQYTYTLTLAGICGSTSGTITTTACGGNVSFTYNGQTVTYNSVSRDYSALASPYNALGTKCWLDRNLGAQRVSIASNDYLAYGDFFQWGRGADGHQLITWTNNSSYAAVKGTSSSQSSSVTPGDKFITGFSNWYNGTSPTPASLWQGVNGTNNPCPTGWRIPTKQELEAEKTSWGTNQNTTGAMASTLKLPAAGDRWTNGTFSNVNTVGFYWTSTVDVNNTYYFAFSSTGVSIIADMRAYGMSIRCIKD